MDIAVICSSAAKDFIETTDDFVSLGTVVKNADVIIKGKDVSTVNKVGVSKGREHKYDLINKRFGDNVSIFPMIDVSLGFSLEKGEVDAIIIDAKRALSLNGDKEKTYDLIGDYDSYTMIASKKIIDTKEFKSFKKEYNEVVKELGNDEVLKNALALYDEKKAEGGFLDWKKWQVQLLEIP